MWRRLPRRSRLRGCPAQIKVIHKRDLAANAKAAAAHAKAEA
jgi:hypothetical protein